MDDLKPLYEIVQPGVPCDFYSNCGDYPLVKWDGVRTDRMVDFTAAMKPVWRLVPPAPLFKWEPDPDAFVAGEYWICNTRDGIKIPWLVKCFKKGIMDIRCFATRAECEQWAEAHARANR